MTSTHASDPAATAELDLVRKLRRRGLVLVAALAALTVCSYALAQYAPAEEPQPGKLELLSGWVEALPIGPSAAQKLEEGLTARVWFSQWWVRFGIFVLPMLAATVATLSATRLLIRSDTVPEAVVRTIRRIGLVAALAILPAYPIFTQDLWLSPLWGRMVLVGANPYAVLPDAIALAGLPNIPPVLTMTYGPLWALIAAGIALVGQGHVFLEFVVSKLVLLGAWLVTLGLLRRVAERRSTRDAAISTCLMAWLPGPLWLTIGDGHNDIAMVMFLVLWFALVTGRRPLMGPLALVGAMTIKYVAAPLVAVDALYVFLKRRATWWAYGAALAVAAVVCLLIFAPFLETGEFLKPLQRMRRWDYFSPATALTRLLSYLPFPVSRAIVEPLVTGSMLTVLLLQLRALWRGPSPDTLNRVVLAGIVFATFGLVGHVWPWFLLWGLPFAVLSWRYWLGQAFLAVAIFSPVLNLAWTISRDWYYRTELGILMYAGAGLLVLALNLSPLGRQIRSETAPEWDSFPQ